MLHAEQRPEHIGVEGGGIGVGGLLRHRTGLAFGAGVVDGRVQATEACDGLIDQVPHLVLVAHIRAQEFDVGAERAQLLRELLAGGLMATSDHDSVTFAREGQRRRTPDSSQRAGDHDNRGVHIAAPFRFGRSRGPADEDVHAPSDAGGRLLVARPSYTLLAGWPYLGGMGHVMELRHLRYFVAVAEEGSLTVAAERRLHTTQPSLSRQLRDLEYEVGAQLMIRNARGIELTAAGRVFLDHARLALAQVDAAGEAARRAAQPAKPSFALGSLKLSVSFETNFRISRSPFPASIPRTSRVLL